MSQPSETVVHTTPERSNRSTKSAWPQAMRLAATTALVTFLFTFIFAGSWLQPKASVKGTQEIDTLEGLASALTRTAEVAGSSLNAVAVITLLAFMALLGLVSVGILVAMASELFSRAQGNVPASREYVISWANMLGAMSQRIFSLYVAVLISTALVAHNAGLPIAASTSASADEIILAGLILLAASFPVQVASRFVKVFGPLFRKFDDRFNAMGLRRNVLRSGTK